MATSGSAVLTPTTESVALAGIRNTDASQSSRMDVQPPRQATLLRAWCPSDSNFGGTIAGAACLAIRRSIDSKVYRIDVVCGHAKARKR
jgi:hypothetical protein